MHLLILDTNNLLCRAFFVGDKIYSNNNKPIGAICAMATYIQSLIRLLAPTHLAMTRDMGGKTWRHKTYTPYKQNRTKADEELYLQFPMVPILAKHMNVPLLEHPDYEADDCIATLATQAQEHAHVTIVSTDKDLCQLVNKKVRIYSPHHKQIITEENVKQRYEVEIEQLIDYFALVGDTSDNLPGVSGIGPKSAVNILKYAKTVDDIDKILLKLSPAIQKKLNNQTEQIKLMKQLVTLISDVSLTTPFSPSFFELFKIGKYIDTSINTLKTIL